MWIVGSRLVGRVVPSTASSCFRSSSSGRLRGRSETRSSTPSMGTRRPRLRAAPAGRSHCVAQPPFNDHLCRASLPREHMDAAVTSMKSAEVWSGLAERIRALAGVATLYPEGMKNKHSGKGKSRLRLLMAAATFQRYQWYLNNARLRSTVACQQAALLGTGTCGSEALHAELRGVFRQAHNASVPTFRLKLDLFKLSRQVSFDGARRIP